MIFKSFLPPADIPAVDVPSFYVNVSKTNLETPDSIAYYDVSTEKYLSFTQLYAMYLQIGSGLVNRLGIKPGDVVALFSSNSIYYAAAFLGIISAGAVCCTVSSVFKEGELEYQMADCKAKALLVGPKQASVARSALNKGLLNIPEDNIAVLGDNDTQGFLSFTKILSDMTFAPVVFNDKQRAESTLAVIVYSSGTTGLPKGVMLSHRNIVSYTVLSATMFEHIQSVDGKKQSEERNQRSLAILPFAHIYGLTSFVTNSVAGAKTQYIMNDFSVEKFLGAIQKHRIQTASVVPSVLNQMVKHKDLSRYDLSSLMLLGSGGAPLPDGTHGEINKRFPTRTGNGYGMSETCSGVCLMGDYKFVAGSVGFLYPGIQAKIIDPDSGRALGAGEPGELCLRGPTIMMGYLDRPKETAQTIDTDGFLHTGDIAYIAKSGHIFITDRIKELIKYKGLQVPAAELESVLMKHALVSDAAVVGVHDPARNTEVPKAYVVAECPSDKLAEELVEWVASRAADHKRLRGGVEFIDTIPRNPSGKILHRKLRAKHNARHGSKM
ncbi:hypothetical protein LPJ53_002657 [Coemansia erecta]|uniref:Acetyl-CoA synthetase-like protein n=1 Tax=Coemansia erecta TaxID=147472 RepID=A0A9W7Y0Z6_9FUNG|nr:hypothetical protein LPJ53_002657 [Coemansia erecta]